MGFLEISWVGPPVLLRVANLVSRSAGITNDCELEAIYLTGQLHARLK